VSHFGQRVCLVHKLRKLGRSKKPPNRRHHGRGVHQRPRRELIVLLHVHPLAHQARHLRQATPALWFSISSPTDRMRRLPKWSMSSISTFTWSRSEGVRRRFIVQENHVLQRGNNVFPRQRPPTIVGHFKFNVFPFRQGFKEGR
jgi:hypothetical protein